MYLNEFGMAKKLNYMLISMNLEKNGNCCYLNPAHPIFSLYYSNGRAYDKEHEKIRKL